MQVDAYNGDSGSRLAVGALVAFLSLGLLVLVALVAGSIGASSRALDPGAGIARTGAEVVFSATKLNANGAVLLVASSDLGYRPVPIPTPPSLLRWPVERKTLNDHFDSGADRDSWAWILAKTGRVRRIDYLVPRSELERMVSMGRQEGFPGIAPDGYSISADDDGFRRFISADIAPLDDPLYLVVDASYFIKGTEDELMTALAASESPPLSLVLYRAEDDTSVPDAAREALDAATPALRELVGR